MPKQRNDDIEQRGAPLPSSDIAGSRLSVDDIKPGEKIKYTDEEVQLYGGPRDDNARRGRRRRTLGSRPARSA